MDKITTARVARVRARVELIAKKKFGVKFFGTTKEDDIRLLRLAQWEEKYFVPLEWILQTLVPIWRAKFSRHGHRGLGVRIPTLVGNKSEEILTREILRTWPDGQHIAQWRAKTQELQWAAERQGIRTREDWEHPLKAARLYQQRMMREREKRKQFQRIACRRPYRGNPWRTT